MGAAHTTPTVKMPKEVKQKSGIAVGLNKGHKVTPYQPKPKISRTKGRLTKPRHRPRCLRSCTLRAPRHRIVEEQQGQACAQAGEEATWFVWTCEEKGG